jgi:hypothetical protein
MQSTSMQLSPVKDGRHILGEKDTNACLSPAHRSKQSLSVATTPVKRTLFMNTSPKKLLPSPIFAGQKRTRDQVDETDVNNAHVQQPRGLEEESSQSTVKHDSQQVSLQIFHWSWKSKAGEQLANLDVSPIAGSRIRHDGNPRPDTIVPTRTRPNTGSDGYRQTLYRVTKLRKSNTARSRKPRRAKDVHTRSKRGTRNPSFRAYVLTIFF